ncbi:MAG: tetratricopeptide repeat protein [Candidatus Marinimicrobia bacterium]|nr:tetratricopeptide repeat protein [Candidatus Neomarinimicrobiota bacterium]
MKKNLVILLSLLVLFALVTCSKPEKSAEEYWKSGSALYDVENFDGAINEYSSLCKFYPETDYAVKAAFSIAEITKNNLKDYDKAIALYKNIEKEYPESEKSPNALFMIGYIYANELNQHDKAKEAYQYFIEKYPNHVLVSSAQWEIDNMGKTLEELQNIDMNQ